MINQFSGGMNKDFHPSNLQPGEYIEAWNAVHNSVNNGNLYNLSNEEGFSVFSDFKIKRPNNIIIGMYPINGRIIIFSITVFDQINYKTNSSEVGYVDPSGVYNEVVNDSNSDIYTSGFKPTNDQISSYSGFKFLNFNINNKIDCEGRINFNNNLIIYWVDGINKPRFLEIDRDYTAVENQFESLDDQVLITDAPQKTQVDYVETVESGGQLVPGVYQFVVRYVNENNAKTTFGHICNPIPVIEDKRIDGINAYDGVNYDYPLLISKSLKLNVLNIDLNFKYIEVVVIYYQGSSTFPKAYIYKTYPIEDSSLEIIFNGEIGKEVLLDEITETTTAYDTAKHIIQKDGRIFLSNLQSNYNVLDLQPIANKLIISYYIKEKKVDDRTKNIAGLNENSTIPGFQEWFEPNNNFNGGLDPNYKEENNTFEEKGYQRDEVYSFGIIGINKKNEESFVAHIPGINSRFSGWPFLAGYESGAKYPLNSNYKDINGNDLSGQNVWHHQFPPLSLEPHFMYDNLTKETFVRIMGFEIPNLNEVLNEFPEIKNELKEIVIVRQRRDQLNNRSIYAQGLTHQLLAQKTYDRGEQSMYAVRSPGDGGLTGIGLGQQAFDSGILIPSSLYNQITLRIDPFKDNTWVTRLGERGAAFTLGEFDQNFNNDVIDVIPNSNQFNRSCVFYSPETIFTPFNYRIQDYKLKQELIITGNLVRVNPDGVTFETLGIGQDERNITASNKMLFFDYNKIDQIGNKDIYDIGLITKVDFNKGFKYNNTNFNILKQLITSAFYGGSFRKTLFNNSQGESTTLLELNKSYYPFPQIGRVEFQENSNHRDYDILDEDINLENVRTTLVLNGSNQVSRYLNNLKRDNTSYNQYGEIYDGRYIEVKIYKNEPNKDIILSNIFNGDIFITKFQYQCTTGIEVCSTYRKTVLIGATINELVDLREPFTSDPDSPGHVLRGGHYYWVESEINCDYRHRPIDYVDPDDPSTWKEGVPYYPASDPAQDPNGPIMAAHPELNHSNGYNIQYSKENNIKNYFPKPFNFTIVNDYPTRTIYSEQTIEGELKDKNREFLPFNYQDLPKNKGEITGQFVHQNTLYLHTDRSLFKTFVNQSNAIIGSTQEIILGNGKVFSLPPQEVYPLQSGHAGLVHKDTGIHTPFGYFFMDYHNKKVFLFAESLEEISQFGFYDWFKLNVNNLENNIANPNGSGAIAFYDPDHRRCVLSMRNKDGSYNTLSYSLFSKKWTSFHDYSPSVVITMDQNVFSGYSLERGLFMHNSGKYGQYYDQNINPFSVEFSINENKLVSKVFDSLQVLSESFSGEKKELLDFFDLIECWNDYQYSGKIDLKVLDTRDLEADEFDFNVRNSNNQYQLKVPLSRTIDNHGDIYEIDDFSEARFRSKYLVVKLKYLNYRNLYFTLMEIISKIRLSTR